jgi:hypothetical protein
MAIYLYTGVPGSGKTFRVVGDMLQRYYHASDGQYELNQGIQVITNVRGLKLPHLDLDETIKGSGYTKEKFFSYLVQDELQKSIGSSLVYIIDEAQSYFRTKFYDEDVFFFFENHRKLGFDIYLITQHSTIISKGLLVHCEYELKAVPRSLSLFKEFKYKKIIPPGSMSNGSQCSIEVRKFDKHILSLYSSRDRAETIKPKSAFRNLFIGVFLLIGLGVYLVYNTFGPNRTRQVIGSGRSVDASIPGTVKRGSSSPGQDSTFHQVEPDFAAVLPSFYDPSTDALVFRGTKGQFSVSVSQFINEFPPLFHGYGYVHIPFRRFLIYSAHSHSILFPKEYVLTPVAARIPSDKKDQSSFSTSEFSFVDPVMTIGLPVQDQVKLDQARQVLKLYGHLLD